MSNRQRVKRTSSSEPTPLPPLLFSRSQTAKLLNVSAMTLIRMESDGRLQAVKLSPGVSAKTFYRAADIYALIGRRGSDD